MLETVSAARSMRDGPPELKDFPAELGGGGEMVGEQPLVETGKGGAQAIVRP
ncbi:MAG: hypothetical protein KIT82_03200 [Bradyrhizobium sp.]|nr:hypothetical protein [Bradyrhizobium sp.]